MSATRGEVGLAHIRELKPGWDSYGGKAIDPRAIEATSRLMAMLKESDPYIVPCSNGGVQIEWHERGIDCEIEISPKGEVQPLET